MALDLLKFQSEGPMPATAQLTRIHNTKRRFNEVNALNEKFLSLLKAAGNDPALLLGDLSYTDGIMSVECFGHHVWARPRPIMTKDGDFFIEYLLFATTSDKDVPVWSFYLLPDEVLSKSHQGGEDWLCKISNPDAKRMILTEINIMVLESQLLSPSRLL